MLALKLLVVSLLVTVFPLQSTCQEIEYVRNLTRDLLNDYDKRLRPVKEQSEPVNVNVSMDIITIQDLDEVSGKFSIVVMMHLLWPDQTLSWTPADYGYVSNIVLPINDVWHPKLVLLNPHSHVHSMEQDWMTARVYTFSNIAYVVFVPATTLQSTCTIDITYFPFDTQECVLYLSPFGFGSTEIHLMATTSKIMTTFYQDNGEWALVGSKVNKVTAGGGDNMVFTFRLERKPKFIVVNVILPILFMAIINILVFAIPAESGERVGFSVTMLLALAVFLTLVGDNMPKTSDPMPLMSSYLIAILVQSLSMCIVAILNLQLHHKSGNSPLPKCIQFIVKVILCCRRKPAKQSHKTTKVHPFVVDADGMEKRLPPEVEQQGGEDHVTWQDLSKVVDIVSLFAFSVALGLVNYKYIMALKKSPPPDEQ